MNRIASCFQLNVPHGHIARAIKELSEAIRCLAPNAFSGVADLDFLHHTREAAAYLRDFVHAASAQIDLAAVYFEMNGFDINPKRWYFSGFGYVNSGDVWEVEWLADWQTESDDQFVLTGMEAIQEAFAKHQGVQPLYIGIAFELSTYLITCRFMELIAAAHALASKQDKRVRRIPVFATAHEHDTVSRTGPVVA